MTRWRGVAAYCLLCRHTTPAGLARAVGIYRKTIGRLRQNSYVSIVATKLVSPWRVGAVRPLDEARTRRSNSQIIAQRRRNPLPFRVTGSRMAEGGECQLYEWQEGCSYKYAAQPREYRLCKSVPTQTALSTMTWLAPIEQRSIRASIRYTSRNIAAVITASQGPLPYAVPSAITST